jgi:hypothetical protein
VVGEEGNIMTKVKSHLPEMSLGEVFASARAVGSAPDVASLRVKFCLTDFGMERGTLTVTLNPVARCWLATLGSTQGNGYRARFAHGKTANEALEKIEQQCLEWLV